MAEPFGSNIMAALPEYLAEAHAPLKARVAAMVERLAQLPKTIDSDAVSGTCSDLVKESEDLWKEVEATRVGEKAPYLEATRIVDGVFDPLKLSLRRANVPVHDRVTGYAIAKRDAANRKAEAEAAERRAAAKRLQDEAEERERLAAQAREEAAKHRKPEKSDAKTSQAIGHETIAEQLRTSAAQHQAAAERSDAIVASRSADKARTRGGSSLATLQQERTFEILDFDAIPLEQLRPYLDRDAIKKAIKALLVLQKEACLAGDGLTMLRGVRFYLTDKGVIR